MEKFGVIEWILLEDDILSIIAWIYKLWYDYGKWEKIEWIRLEDDVLRWF
jgi:hypothetical protein